MGLLDRLVSKVPSWAKGSPHDAKSAAALLEKLVEYVEANDGTLELLDDRVEIAGARGKRSFGLNEFVYICPADTPQTWDKMLAVALREVIPEAAFVKEAKAQVAGLLEQQRDRLTALAGDAESALSHLRLTLQPAGFASEVPSLLRVAARPAFARFEVAAVYDILPQAAGIPASHLTDVSVEKLIERARSNTFDVAVTQSGFSIAGPFAGTRIIDPARVIEDDSILVTAPHQDLLLAFGTSSGDVTATLEAMVTQMYESFEGGPIGGTGRSLYWWRQGTYREIPTIRRTMERAGESPYHYRLPDLFKREVL